MFLSPSEIHFITDTNNSLQPDKSVIVELSNKYAEKPDFHKIQVTEKDGAWFALNNSYLHVFRELERQGKCARIKVDVVPLSRVPETLQTGMMVIENKTVAPSNGEIIKDEQTNDEIVEETDTTRATRRGYHKLSENAEENGSDGETEGNSSYSGSDFSEYDEDTDSEYDEALTCNVCDRSFSSTRVLAQHQQKKRHFGCSICDEIFPSLMSLEQHKEGLDHWSEDEGNAHDSESDVDSDAEKSEPEELECLL